MRDEYTALIKNNAWTLVPRPPDANVVRCMWLFRCKYMADDTLSCYKALFVANGSTQLEGIDLDVKNAFFHEDLSEMVYMHQPPEFQDFAHPEQRMTLAYLFLYVDDIVLTASSSDLLHRIIRSLHQEFAMTDLVGLLLKLSPNWVIQVCLHMHDPWESHLSALKWILHYVRRTFNYGLQLFSSSTTDLVAYSDVDWAGCPITRRSTSDYCVFLGNNLLSWSSKRQPTLSRSSVDAEYRGVANVVAEICWLRNLLRELHTPLYFATLVYCDNVSAVYLSCNPVQHQRTKHIEIDIHFVHDLVAAC
nr:ribonuclease H-like domain-containing protein [Tanacetum cinerariifolium]